MRIASIVCFLGLLFAPCAIAGHHSEGLPVDQPQSPELLTCWISMAPGGEAVSYVPASYGNANSTFWLNFISSTTVTKANFLVKFNSSSALTKHIQKFENITSVTTPFAWPGYPIVYGPAMFKVSTDLGKCIYLFTAGGKNFESADTPPIPDVASIDTHVTTSGIGTISKVVVALSVVHTFDGDLHMLLIGPDGSYSTLTANRGGSGDNYGDTGYKRTVFDDAAATPITSGAAPFVGMFVPESPLSVFNGKSGAAANGIWTLRIVDEAGGDVGHVEGWSLTIVD